MYKIETAQGLSQTYDQVQRIKIATEQSSNRAASLVFDLMGLPIKLRLERFPDPALNS